MRKDQHFNVKLTSDDSLKALFECQHDEIVCVKCIGRGSCPHDCERCREERDGSQLHLFQEGN